MRAHAGWILAVVLGAALCIELADRWSNEGIRKDQSSLGTQRHHGPVDSERPLAPARGDISPGETSPAGRPGAEGSMRDSDDECACPAPECRAQELSDVRRQLDQCIEKSQLLGRQPGGKDGSSESRLTGANRTGADDRQTTAAKAPGNGRAEQLTNSDGGSTEEQSIRQARREQLDSWLEADLVLSPGEIEILGEWACSLRELRWLDLESMNDPASEAAALRESLQEDRYGILKGIEDLLGKEKYKQLRDLGGIGMLNEVTDCPGDAR